ncbi:hypothetical protein AVEN_252511-1 [Araneus ventricosus]|uniref:Uncharacterized protein n=1 Tax=Araneus ventricosus TaxID=182803 RepID=A0A4Y2AQX7_ARAVE|nr:hypothetical protein AVEN_252511-1 [Araneus ventricosus]
MCSNHRTILLAEGLSLQEYQEHGAECYPSDLAEMLAFMVDIVLQETPQPKSRVTSSKQYGSTIKVRKTTHTILCQVKGCSWDSVGFSAASSTIAGVSVLRQKWASITRMFHGQVTQPPFEQGTQVQKLYKPLNSSHAIGAQA